MPSIAKLESVIAAETGGAEASSASESPAGAPPTGNGSGAELAPEAESTEATATAGDATSSGASIPDEQATKRALLAEKLAEARERRAAQRLQANAKEIAKQAQADREAAAKERAEWEGVRGNYKEGLAKLGVDPAAALREMVKEATEAGTPEAQIAKMAADFQKRIDAIEEDRKAEREALELERRRSMIAEKVQRFQADFVRAVALPEFEPLRDEYDDRQIYGFADVLRQNPQQMVTLAKQFGVALTSPAKGFTMKEILSVLRGQQARHEAERQARRAQRTATHPSTTPEQASSEKQTVNGTAERRNAGATLGNELASTRASDSARRLTRAQRVKALIDKG